MPELTVGFKSTEVSALEAPRVAVIVAVVNASTFAVVAASVPTACPAGMVTFTGTVRLALDELNNTVAPPVGAAELSRTLPVVDVPLTSVELTSVISSTRNVDVVAQFQDAAATTCAERTLLLEFEART